jgi:hypothetical protein
LYPLHELALEAQATLSLIAAAVVVVTWVVISALIEPTLVAGPVS